MFWQQAQASIYRSHRSLGLVCSVILTASDLYAQTIFPPPRPSVGDSLKLAQLVCFIFSLCVLNNSIELLQG